MVYLGECPLALAVSGVDFVMTSGVAIFALDMSLEHVPVGPSCGIKIEAAKRTLNDSEAFVSVETASEGHTE